MAKKNNALLPIVAVLLALVLLVLLNPTQADFSAHLKRSSAAAVTRSGSSGGLGGVLTQGAAAVSGALGGAVGGAYKRSDYLLFSTYTLGSGAKSTVYLGLAKLFIKLK